MKLRTVHAILRKELLETLRDKRTLIAMVGIPLLLYPALILVMAQALTVQQSKIKEAESRVAVSAGEAEEVRECVEAIPKVRIVHSREPGEALRAGELDAVVVAEAGTHDALTGTGSAEVRVQYDSTEVESQEALRRIKKGLRAESDRLLQQRLKRIGKEREFAEPIKIVEQNVAPPKKQAGHIVGMVLPMVMIMMLGVGAFYPAVDLTAGEKERGTFETLLSTPTSKTEIVCGKFLTVFCISIITALLNLGSMTLSLQMTTNLPVQITPLDVGLILLILVPLAFFICSVMMSIALFARTFKEAQNYVTPFYIFIMLPAMVAALPGMKLSPGTVFVPITNVALLFRDLLTEKTGVEAVFSVFLSTAVYALLALVVAVWLFQREEVILSEEKGFPLTLRRSAFVPRKAATLGLSLMLFALTLLLLFYVGTYVQSRNMIRGLLITEWGLILLPAVLILWYVRVDLRESLRCKGPPLAAVPATVLIAAGTCVLVVQISVWQSRVLPIPDEMTEAMKNMFVYDGTVRGLMILLLATAVSPAICEEVLFRGAILSGVRSRLSAGMSILVVAVLFGLFHVSVYRLLATGLLGAAITYVVLRAGSIYVGMLFHFLHNATVVLASTGNVPGPIRAFLEAEQVDAKGFPAWVLLSALAVLVAGIVLMEMTRREPPRLQSAPANG